MAPINAVTTASKELGNKVISKIRGLVSSLPAAPENNTAQPPSDTIRLIDSNFNEYTFSELQRNIPRKKLAFLNLDGSAFVLLCRQTLNGAFAMYNGTSQPKMHKECLITTGATAAFPELVAAALTPESLEAFARQGFTKLTFQLGESIDLFRDTKPPMAECFGLEIEAFDFNQGGLEKEMKACLADEDKSLEGMVITHAGAGTILDAMRLSIPTIVVPNVSLLDNHQEELADELVRQGYVTKSTPLNLARAIRVASDKAKEPRIPHGQHPRSLPSGLASIIDSLVGYEIDMDDYDDDEEGGVKLVPDEEIERELGQEEQVKSMLD